VKEGRKYDLGAVLITQQPGAIPNELLSQGDNWFIFHLLSAGDLQNLRGANSHFSADILGSLLNEPIPGQGIFWSSAAGREYPIPLRIDSFEKNFTPLDPKYNRAGIETFATKLRGRSAILQKNAEELGVTTDAPSDEGVPEPEQQEQIIDVAATQEKLAIDAVKNDADLMARLRGDGVKWGQVQSRIAKAFESIYSDAFQKVYTLGLVRTAMDGVFGKDGWTSRKDAQGKAVIRAKK
jgi:hypothetical protein